MRLAKISAGLGAVLIAALVVVSAGQNAWAALKRVPHEAAEVQLSYAPIVKQVAPAVVNIYTRRVVRTVTRSPLFNDPFFSRFFGEGFGFGLPRERVQNSLGSGVIVRPNGIIITNNHVIEGADQITVALLDRREYDAELVLADERTDLAVLRIDTDGEALPNLPLGDSDMIEVGDIVLAIGNPFGFGQTVTTGIVSALARTQTGVSDYQFFIQTDAAINPGNSGGALVSMDGRLIGINTAIFSRSGGSHGIGFATPVNMVAAVIEGALADGEIIRPWFGASGQTVTAEIGSSLGLDRPAGVLVNGVQAGGPADRAGLEVGDVVLKVDAQEVFDARGLQFRIGTHKVGGSVRLDVVRRNRALVLNMSLEAPPEEPPRNLTELRGNHPFSGLVVGNMSPAYNYELARDLGETGIVVAEATRGSRGFRRGFRGGDVILSVRGQNVGRVAELQSVLDRPANSWPVSIRRGQQVINVTLR